MDISNLTMLVFAVALIALAYAGLISGGNFLNLPGGDPSQEEKKKFGESMGSIMFYGVSLILGCLLVIILDFGKLLLVLLRSLGLSV